MFLANVRYMLLPVRLLSVCNARAPYSGGWNFRQTLAIRWHPWKIIRKSSEGNPSVGGVKRKKRGMSCRLVSKSVTLNDLEHRNGPYFALFHRIRYLPGRTA